MNEPIPFRAESPAACPGALSHPSKIFLEVTTRCNLRCPMCVKQSSESGIEEGDLSESTFRGIEAALPRVGALVFSGIGEPLLHPRVTEWVGRARKLMAPGATIGMQSNGFLMTEARARALADAGLDRVCLSVDAVSPELFRSIRRGGELEALEAAFDALGRAATARSGRCLEVGIECVLRQDNMEELPGLLRWAAGHGARFALVSHLIAYRPDMSGQVAFGRNTDDALAFFRERSAEAERRGIDISRYYAVRWKYAKTEEERLIADYVDSMVKEATSKGIFFHLRNLMEDDPVPGEKVGRLFEEARRVAAETGLELTLPEAVPRGRKRCEFVEEGAVFVSWRGDAHPCHFLWHRFACHVSGWRKVVSAQSFGNIGQRGLLEIWDSEDYRRFRRTVLAYDYPLCSNCPFAPCDYITSEVFEQDCHTNTIPCCDCQWCLGVFNCLG